MNPYPEETTQLLQKAAKCYLKAGWLTEACRVWEQIGDYHQAAQTYEQLADWEKAGDCYQKAKNWSNGARCYLMCGQAQAAAECWIQAGETLLAAWIRADSLQQIYQIQAQLTNFVAQTDTQAIEIALITARCQASAGKKTESAIILSQQLEPLLKQRQKHLFEWALTIASVLNRPDLTALVYATAYRAKIANICQQWEKWAISTLKDATGVPIEEETDSLKTYSFKVVSVNRTGEIVRREWHQARYFTEALGNGIGLEMVYIPGGTFMMGSPEDEEDSFDRERPQHLVTVQQFYMGKYPVTQAQWRAVANFPQIKRSLNPDPSEFKGDELPVECVSWDEAVEFCDRLTNKTGKNYRLPSEAEWEYGCRGGTTTPFHFGETITPELANYNGNYTYGSGLKGEYREQTTPVGSFGVANSFGLYDMHGNVWEWCADQRQGDYEGAPGDGSVWILDDNDNSLARLLRGGSWYDNPSHCRSACRHDSPPDNWHGPFGFRVVLSGART